MSEAHASFCTDHSEGICRASDLTADKWEIGLADDGTGSTIYLFHPEIIAAVEYGAMAPEGAVELGRALMIQGTRALRSRPRRKQAESA
jgi:hypothetical protein